MKKTLLMLILAMILPAHAEDAPDTALTDPQGWHWYNEPQEEDEQDAATPPPGPAMTPMEQMAALQKQTKERLAIAIMEPTVENFARFKQLQDFWTEQAGKFSMVAQQSMLAHPELDYNLKYSHYNGTAKTQLAADRAQEKSAIEQIASQYGVFFFYRGKEPMDNQLAQVVKSFSESNGIALISVSVDGMLSSSLPNSRYDSGQAQRLGVSFFPAMFLVDPKGEQTQPLAYGFISQDDLARRFLNVATGFKPNF
ncbi:type-F conjugative transfer system pilin assembly protein TraF [Chimaeribacter arupi]|uniref:type-F conjugative transfer system pilin assembly protein TraF n=1 Tax=Chimaeribacter arupi TaxID=2060066 RepID=UPI000C7ACE39|nr:type-F conjugative transfer system pilin assembly protein TraF [Chimaeribacter arupi]PLR30060.1 type-F conjugative transfer system pilin assembly protein TraF [Chimaeribacter arupi]